MKKTIGKLCIITDIVIQTKYSHFDIAQMAIEGGADMIQLRDKTMPANELIEKAIIISALCRKAGVQFIVDDRVDVALVAESDGVHLGKEDISVAEARKALGEGRIIGATAHSLAEAIDAQEAGADYIGFGHIYPTYTKKKNTNPKGLESLKKVCSAITVPVLAIGGINPDNAFEVMKCGAYGIAVVGSVVKSNDPRSAVRKLKKIVDD